MLPVESDYSNTAFKKPTFVRPFFFIFLRFSQVKWLLSISSTSGLNSLGARTNVHMTKDSHSTSFSLTQSLEKITNCYWDKTLYDVNLKKYIYFCMNCSFFILIQTIYMSFSF